MKKGEIVEGVIERIQFPNKGIMSVEDTKVTVNFNAYGQKVMYAAFAKLQKI